MRSLLVLSTSTTFSTTQLLTIRSTPFSVLIPPLHNNLYLLLISLTPYPFYLTSCKQKISIWYLFKVSALFSDFPDNVPTFQEANWIRTCTPGAFRLIKVRVQVALTKAFTLPKAPVCISKRYTCLERVPYTSSALVTSWFLTAYWVFTAKPYIWRLFRDLPPGLTGMSPHHLSQFKKGVKMLSYSVDVY